MLAPRGRPSEFLPGPEPSRQPSARQDRLDTFFSCECWKRSDWSAYHLIANAMLLDNRKRHENRTVGVLPVVDELFSGHVWLLLDPDVNLHGLGIDGGHDD